MRCSTLSHCSTAAGTELQCCCADVHGSGIGTGFYRDGFCSTGPQDEGRHTVCIEATEKFLAVSAAVGNPLHQAIPEYSFPGVRPGDCWCLCASRLGRRDSTSRLQPRAVQAATLWPHASRLQPYVNLGCRFAQMLELEAEGAVQNAEGETVRDFVPRIYLQVRPCPATTAFPLVITRRTTSAVASLFTSQSYGRSATLTLQATHEKTLEHVPLETLMRYAIDADEAQAELARIDGLRAQLAKGVSFEAE